jgi:hypothetical protein
LSRYYGDCTGRFGIMQCALLKVVNDSHVIRPPCTKVAAVGNERHTTWCTVIRYDRRKRRRAQADAGRWGFETRRAKDLLQAELARSRQTGGERGEKTWGLADMQIRPYVSDMYTGVRRRCRWAPLATESDK